MLWTIIIHTSLYITTTDFAVHITLYSLSNKINYDHVTNNYKCLMHVCTCTGPLVILEGGNSYNEGRVEIYYNYQWGTVCDDGWDDTDAGVVCRQLGFGSSGTAIGLARFGQGSGSIWLDNVMCNGSEPTLASCGHLGVGITRSCSHSEDAGVRCYGTQGKHITTLKIHFDNFKWK